MRLVGANGGLINTLATCSGISQDVPTVIPAEDLLCELRILSLGPVLMNEGGLIDLPPTGVNLTPSDYRRTCGRRVARVAETFAHAYSG